MAGLRFEDGSTTRDPARIADALRTVGVQLAYRPINPAASALASRIELEEDEKAQLLASLEHDFALASPQQDLIVLQPQTANLDALTARFESCHTHSDDEVRYIVDGEGCFGFVRPDGVQFELTVEAGDYIAVPAGTEHWFRLTAQKRIKAVRYFSGTAGWVPVYTQTPVRLGR
ncbi:cupin domain-containing protein [Gloeobacter kilaueensis]|uniref:Acireductone dioxygenase n=1 Tax=Gloeobacter kilaueensis (strain ATCC BAA-2537 / CCAP 1431/1 / ULC 316 / JS1) TaxID=1183438 RepID=U5QES7_GLOK1|nr:cupin domain-containing protein [Gloeobacter kilaueensis]AGY57416.1 1,2-dihydroxy-3-keto-5-methylthiopentene dioxygenase [Gloeobacter kilaueensis JS1]